MFISGFIVFGGGLTVIGGKKWNVLVLWGSKGVFTRDFRWFQHAKLGQFKVFSGL